MHSATSTHPISAGLQRKWPMGGSHYVAEIVPPNTSAKKKQIISNGNWKDRLNGQHGKELHDGQLKEFPRRYPS